MVDRNYKVGNIKKILIDLLILLDTINIEHRLYYDDEGVQCLWVGYEDENQVGDVEGVLDEVLKSRVGKLTAESKVGEILRSGDKRVGELMACQSIAEVCEVLAYSDEELSALLGCPLATVRRVREFGVSDWVLGLVKYKVLSEGLVCDE